MGINELCKGTVNKAQERIFYVLKYYCDECDYSDQTYLTL